MNGFTVANIGCLGIRYGKALPLLVCMALMAACSWPTAGFARFWEKDTTQVKEWLQKAESLEKTQPDSALGYYNLASEESLKLKYKNGEVRSKVGKASILFGQNLAGSIALAKEALDECERYPIANNSALRAEAHLLMASAYEEQGRADSSAYYYYLLMQQTEGEVSLPPSFAVNLYTKLAIFLLNSYGGIKGTEEYKNLLSGYVERAKAAAGQMEDQRDAVSATYFLQGAYRHAIRQFDSARFFYHSYLQERELLGQLNWQRKASTLLNLAESYLEENKGREAEQYILKAKEVLKSPAAEQYSQYFDGYADLMLARACQMQGRHAQAVSLIEHALIQLGSTSERMNLTVAEGYNTASASYESLGNLKQALFYKNLYVSLHDSLMRKENLDLINGMEVRYRMVEKDKELAESKLTLAAASQKVRNRNLVVGIAVSLLAFGGILAYVWSRKNEHKARLQKEKLDNLQRNLEIERLNATLAGEEMERNRIARELHDGVGGILSAAKMNLELFEKRIAFADRTDLREGIRLLQQASSELRKTAHNLMPETLIQEGLPKAIQSYCASLSGKRGLDIKVQVLGESRGEDPGFEFSVYRIVQELVHNMVRHSKATEGLVELNYRQDGGIDLTIEDNGIGLPQQEKEQVNGMGLHNVKQRIKAINGRMDIQTSPGNGTSFYIEFDPKNKPQNRET